MFFPVVKKKRKTHEPVNKRFMGNGASVFRSIKPKPKPKPMDPPTEADAGIFGGIDSSTVINRIINTAYAGGAGLAGLATISTGVDT